MVRILLADDHTLVRQGIRRILEEHEDWQVIGETSDGREAVRQALELQPDVVIMDVGMLQLNGIEATRQIVRRAPSTRVLILSMHAEEAYITRAVEAGAMGYLLKDSADAELVKAVTAAIQGRSFFSPKAALVLLDEHRKTLARRGIADRYESLSEREREVFQLIAEGHSNKSMAAILGVAPATVDTHRGHVMEKLDLHSVAQIVLYAVRLGIIS